MSLELVPISLKEANKFVEEYHRHHKPVVGHKFSIAVAENERIVAFAMGSIVRYSSVSLMCADFIKQRR